MNSKHEKILALIIFSFTLVYNTAFSQQTMGMANFATPGFEIAG